jgi:uncharacterized protein (TIGR00290 family)
MVLSLSNPKNNQEVHDFVAKKFTASYSGGKDSVLAIYRAIGQGYEPLELITTYNIDENRSWFHGIPETVLESVSASLNIPVRLIKTAGKDYAQNFEEALLRSKKLGAEICVFGDIDIEDHKHWCSERCRNTGLDPLFPLWGEDRKKLVYEFVDSGFTANITVIDTRRMSDGFLGKTLTRETADCIAAQGADICGENGEYHTFVSAGPIFRKPIEFFFGEKIIRNGYAVLPISRRLLA